MVLWLHVFLCNTNYLQGIIWFKITGDDDDDDDGDDDDDDD